MTAINNLLQKRRPSQSLGLYATLIPPLLWMSLLYFIPIALLISYSVWRLDGYDVVKEFSLTNFQAIFSNPGHFAIGVKLSRPSVCIKT